MNIQTHLSGQFLAQVPNQLAPNQLTQQNVGAMNPVQMQNLAPGAVGIAGAPVGSSNNMLMGHELQRARLLMQERIYGMITRRQAHPISEQQKQKYRDVVRRLEEGLVKNAQNMEEYLDMSTLESRMNQLIKQMQNNGNNQRRMQLVNTSPSVGTTMIPTPGVAHSGNSIAAASSVDTMIPGSESIATTAGHTGRVMPTNGMHGSLSRSDVAGNLTNGYQQSLANFSITSGDNISTMGGQGMMGQMIPTPGFNNNNNNSNSNSNSNNTLISNNTTIPISNTTTIPISNNTVLVSNNNNNTTNTLINNQNHNSHNQSYISAASSNNLTGFSTVGTTIVSQKQQNQLLGGQNSHVLLSSQLGGNMRSGLLQTSYGSSHSAVNGGIGMVANNLQVNEPGISEGYMTATSYTSSPKPLQQQYDQHQRQLMLGNGYGVGNSDSIGSGNLYGPVASVGSMINSQNFTATNLQSIPITNSSVLSNQSNLPGSQEATHFMPESVNQAETVKVQSHQSLRENYGPYQQQQFQKHPNQLISQKFVQQTIQKQQSLQHQPLVGNDAFGLPEMPNHNTQVKLESGMENHGVVLHQQVSGQQQKSELHDQFQHNVNSSGDAKNLTFPPAQQQMRHSLSQTSQQMQLMLNSESQNGFYHPSNGLQSGPLVQEQWSTQLQDRIPVPSNTLHEQDGREDIQQRISGLDEAHCYNLSSEGSISGQPTPSRVAAEAQTANGTNYRSGNAAREAQFKNQMRWMLFVIHARNCEAPKGTCPEFHCTIVQDLLQHMEKCNLSACPYPRCQGTKVLVRHRKNCRDAGCPVCVPVKTFMQMHGTKVVKQIARPDSDFVPAWKPERSGENSPKLISKSKTVVEPSLKRIKMEQPPQSLIPVIESSLISSAATGLPVPLDVHRQDKKNMDTFMSAKSEGMKVKSEVPVNSLQVSPSPINNETKQNRTEDCDSNHRPDAKHIVHDEPSGLLEQKSGKVVKEADLVKQEPIAQHSVTETKSGKPEIKGVSMIELFTPEQVREHIVGLRQWVGQSKAKAEKNQAMEHSMSENSCQLCAVEKLSFEPPPIYCSLCGTRIKRNAMYYTGAARETRHYFCIPCYNEARGDTISVDGASIAKARVQKKKNDEEAEEWWVQCDKCEAWQHQICALFNGRRNDGGQAEYTCPNCYMAEVEMGDRSPLPQSAVLGAKDLPRTILSDHIEQRLFRKLKQERQERAKLQGKSFDEVPGAEALVVRVVSSVDKKLEVKPRFYEIFREENYPTEFPYKSKVILLFQKIEGVEVCLFGMYVQEFGSECQFPNERRVYLAYLDSVKYFRPEIKAVTGEALRTFVYHEILIGYLEYCKMRGFTSCYIWACPPLKGEDYILYCHPEIQKTPKSDKLREWYLSMLRKATREEIVVELTNLYDHFFTSMGECKAKVTAARLPYFDGDYWPGAAEDLIYQLNQEEDGRKQNKKGTIKKTITKRALKASGQLDLSGNASKDLLLMHKLGDTISPMKEDFIMVHLQHCCSHCCILMVSGNRWVCKQCKNFQICDKCYEVEQKREERERHPVNHRDKHVFDPVEINDVPVDTKDKDDILESEFFDTRQAFLSLCQGNHYQYDTLRRAKHSSMMVLYHLHNPTAPAFVTTCNVCHLDIETGQGWRCEVCPDYDVCNSCYQKDGVVDHPHKLTNHPSMADRDAQNKEARELRVSQLRKMLDLLVHAAQCRSPQCQYPNCRKVKGLFRHGIYCKKRVSGGCLLCKRMWYLLQLHARACKVSECHVPRCRDLKDHLRRLQQQSDSRRRAAVNEMMRQRAAEVAGNSG